MNNEDIAIKVASVSKTFKLPHERKTSIKSAFINLFRKTSYEKQEALKNISFEVKKGEFFGIVGRNGSGKSTLLKLIAGIYTPTNGNIHVNGTLTPFIELGVGFNPELTGRENVFLNGALLGFSRREMEKLYKDIVEFAELEKFMDQKLKNYSSGMQVRLAFSIATRANSEILILDEVLAVGDAEFQQKCFEHFEYLKEKKVTILLVTHDMATVNRFCDRALIIEKGTIKKQGTPEEVAGQYMLDNMANDNLKENAFNQFKRKKLVKAIRSLEAKQISSKKRTKEDNLEFQVTYILNSDLAVDLGYSIVSQGFSVAEQNTKALSLPSTKGKEHTISCVIPLENFNSGSYTVDIAMFKKQNFSLIGYHIGSMKFVIEGLDKFRGGPMQTNGEWTVRNG